MSIENNFFMLNVSKYFNNKGISFNKKEKSNFDLGNNGYAGWKIPLKSNILKLYDIPFIIQNNEKGYDNFISDGQRISVQRDKYKYLFCIGASTVFIERFKVRVGFVYEDNSIEYRYLKFSGWIFHRALHNDKLGVVVDKIVSNKEGKKIKIEKNGCKIWMQTLYVNSEKKLKEIVFGYNPSIHIFGITLSKGMSGKLEDEYLKEIELRSKARRIYPIEKFEDVKKRKIVKLPYKWKGDYTDRYLKATIKINSKENQRVKIETGVKDAAIIYANNKLLYGNFENELGKGELADGKINKNFNILVELRNRKGEGNFYLCDIVYEDKDIIDYLKERRILLAINERIKCKKIKKEVDKIAKESFQILYRGDLEGAKKKLEKAKEKLREKRIDLNFHFVHQSHLDLAWMWREIESHKKFLRTTMNTLEKMRKFPDLINSQSTPQYFEWLEEEYPEVFKEVKKRIKEGRYEVVGGMWVEADVNLPSGESLVRQILYGKKYWREKFGVEVKVDWLVDSFGFPWSLPQIYKKSGIEYMVTTKLGWNDTNEFPYNLFYWEGPDGSRIIVHQTELANDGVEEKISNFNNFIKKYKTKNKAYAEQKIYTSKDNSFREGKKLGETDDILMLYGIGDGGGGASVGMVKYVKMLTEVWKNFKYNSTHKFFKIVGNKYKGKLPIWKDELYLELHQGTYTTRGKIKRLNREIENMLVDSEKLWSNLNLIGSKYPIEKFERWWKILLKNQFHDILPGCSIKDVYKDVYPELEGIKKEICEMYEEGIKALAKKIKIETSAKRNLIVFNPLSWERKNVIEIKGIKKKKVILEDEEGKEIVPERYGEKLIFIDTLPSVGYKTYKIKERKKIKKEDINKIDDYKLENEYIVVEIDKRNGFIKRMYDKRERWNIFKGDGAELEFFIDVPKIWEAWDIAKDYNKHKIKIENPKKIIIEETEGIVKSIRVEREINDSKIEYWYRLYKDMPYLEIEYKIDWKESRKLLKLRFPFNIKAEKGVFEIPYGIIERPTKPKSKMEKAKWEVYGHKWVDISDGEKGIAVINDCKYGYDINKNHLRVSLLRAPIEPDKECDKCEHKMKFWILPHKGNWQNEIVVRMANELNHRVKTYLVEAKKIKENKSPEKYSFIEIDKENIIIEAIKKSEDRKGLVIRLYELFGKATECEIKINSGKVRKAEEINFIETEVLKKVKVKGDILKIKFKPYEIKAIKIET